MAYVQKNNVDNKCRGSVYVETAMSMMVFLTLVFSTIDIMRYGFAWLSVQHAVSVGARYASLMVDPPAVPAPHSMPSGLDADFSMAPVYMNPNPGPTRASLIKQKIVDSSFGNVDAGKAGRNIKICTAANPNCPGNDVGGPNETITIEVTAYFKPLIGMVVPGEKFSTSIKAAATIRNEPFSQSF